MKNSSDSKLNFKEITLWLGVLLVTIFAFLGTYYFDVTAPIKAIIWIGWLILVAVLGFFTSKGKQVFAFAKEAKIELQKVVWPTRQETVQTTSIVMVMVAVTGFVLWGVDSAMMWAIAKLTHLG
ncbi:preprotein translocase subunit SecE [Legionella jamestowniensis]|uniref:Protein translocase subunit SecE n=1 Tax=Legionella jamestowniensis TaxID=455 RepID=A0A0W0UYU4_9GAMM|nr:preprotein translocase subunit SecE [Legionella jamestowniensis]KTD13056.1 preprotein translocase subunit SecE [Legionella jamestowniensis]OCH98455.1 preprotein translocase subunit SecE [Legionella jamestowniensis]SFM09854.1 preprotein translocase subunit SecE [Legionella jamestowniensis DSM 19215]